MTMELWTKLNEINLKSLSVAVCACGTGLGLQTKEWKYKYSQAQYKNLQVISICRLQAFLFVTTIQVWTPAMK